MANLINYKCPNCGGIVEFDSALQQMKCPYCDSVFSIADFEEKEAILNNAQADDFEIETSGSEWSSSEDSQFGLYHCETCGAEIIADETTAATHCPYCDNPIILTGRVAAELKPDLIIPFRLDKKAAKQALKKHISGRKLLPRVFSSENHLDEIKGVYVPFWLFDTEADVSSSYEMTRTRTWTDSRYQYTETKNYHADRAGTMYFDNVPVDGSSKMDDDLMDSLELYDFSNAVEFKTAYLAGYFANRYDVSSEECKSRAKRRIFRTAEEQLDRTVTGYDSVRQIGGTAYLKNTKVKYALLPVWIMNTSWRGKNYIFAMNGQTGKFVGNLPIDKGRYWKYRLLYGLGIGGGLFALTALAQML